MQFLTLLSSTPQYMDFILPELKSMLRYFGVPLKSAFSYEIKEDQYPDSDYQINQILLRNYPFLFLNLPSQEIAKQICSRTVLTVLMLDIFCETKSYDELKEIASKGTLSHQFQDQKMKFQLYIDAFNANKGPDNSLQKIDQITDWFKMKGSIDLKNPDRCFWVYEVHNFEMRSIDQTKSLEKLFFGEEVARNRVTATERRKENHQYQLSNRIYLGPTSTDNNLSFLMANQGAVSQGDFVLDPFVGTGSLLIPPAHHGAVTFGCDIDPRVIQGLGVGRLNKQSKLYQDNLEFVQNFTPQINLNFYQYGLPYPNIFRMDVTNNAFRKVELFDCLICDPPYGWRASTRVVGVNLDKKAQQEQKLNYKLLQDQLKSESESNNSNKESPSLKEDQTELVQQQQQLELIKEKLIEDIEEKQTNETQKQGKSRKNKEQQQSGKFNSNQESEEKQLDEIDSEEQEEDEDDEDSEGYEKDHTPQQILVSVNLIVENLFKIAEKSVQVGGYLVFLYPIQRYETDGKLKVLGHQHFPSNERFILVDFSQHVLTKQQSRILITMQKIK